jgi:hypothetical protein
MATYTTLLKLALPTPGTEAGTWGTTVNNSITSLLDSAVAGSATEDVTLSDWTLSDVDGVADDARCAILVPTGSNGGTARSILAPNRDKVYIVINKASGSVAIKGVTGPTTGVTITTGKTALVAWNGVDFVEITPSTISGTLPVASGGTGVTTSTGSGSVVLNTSPSLITPVLGTPTSGNFSSGTFTWPTFNQDTTGYASALKSASTTVSVSASTAPSNGQVLTATSSTTATWQTPTSSGGTVTSVAALTLGTTGTDFSSSVANSTTTPVITLNLPTASATNRGALSSTDWSTFNGKQAALGTASASVSGILSSTDWSTFNGKYSTGGALGTPSSGTLSSCTVDGTNAVGYKNIPQTGSDKTTAYTLVTGDVGKYVGVGTSGSIVVPTSTFANGDAISIYNNTTGNVTITTSAPTAYIAGTNTVKTSITLATRGIATILFVSATVCVVSGNVS